MQRREFIKTSSLAIAGLSTGLIMSCGTKAESRPNILLILADDLGFSDIGCYGSEIKTPNLDRLATEGVRFSHFYNNARCCPSRAALLTGLYPHQAGIGGMTDTDVPIPEYQGFYNENTITIADLLRDAGYKTYLAGKWHQGEEPEHWPLQHGFDRCFSLINGASSYFDFKPYRNDKWPPGNKLTVVKDDKPVDMSGKDFYVTDLYTDHAIRFLEEHNPDSPFFLYMSYTAPHWPMHALPEDIIKYKGVYDAGWDAVREQRFQRLKKKGLISEKTKLSAKNSFDRDWNSLGKEERDKEARLMEVYAAMIDRMDQNIGRLLDQLEKNGQLDNTVILFLSDNGGCAAGNLAYSDYSHSRFDPEAPSGEAASFTGYGKNWANVSNTPFRFFKSNVHEGGIATPFIPRFPKKIPKNSFVEHHAHMVDIMPTLATLAGTNYPGVFKGKNIKPTEGQDLLPAMLGKDTDSGRELYFEHMGNCGIIDGDWKLVRFRHREWELYNLKEDRSETQNLAKTSPELVRELDAKYSTWAKKNKVLSREEVEKQIPHKF